MVKQSLTAAAESFLAKVERRAKGAKATHTRRSYEHALKEFFEVIESQAGLQTDKTPAAEIQAEWVVEYIEALQARKVSPATEQVRLAAIRGFYKHLSLTIPEINLGRLEALIDDNRRASVQNEVLTTDADVEAILKWSWECLHRPFRSRWEKLRAYRNRAFLILLADTGLRVSEACRLRTSHIAQVTPRNLQVTLKIKGGRAVVVRLSENSWNALRAYHRVRAELDRAGGQTPEQLPVFAQHSRLADLQAKRKQKNALLRPWTEAGARQMLELANKEVFGEDYRMPAPEAEDEEASPSKKVRRGRVTPHGLRRYFVRRVYNRHRDLRKAQLLARHRSLTTTQRYIGTMDAELEEAYRDAIEDTKN